MIRKIKLSKRTSNKLAQLLQYLENEWSLKVKNDFIKKLDKSLLMIQENPDYFPKSDSIKGLHRCVVTKQTTIFYRYDSEYVYVVALFDNRRNPSRLKRETSE